MKILLLGSNGQVGYELHSKLSELGSVIAPPRSELDMFDKSAIASVVDRCKPQLIVNAAAYTAVDKAETDSFAAFQINRDAVEILANKAKALNALLIHYSTDYVFDGTAREAYSETDETNPLSIYGRSKLAGEEAIQASGCHHLIFRTSWVYSVRGHNFAKTILKKSKELQVLNVVNDQIGSPTAAELISDVTIACIEKYLQFSDGERNKLSGIYNLTPGGFTSWHGFAVYLLSELFSNKTGNQIEIAKQFSKINPVLSSEYPTAAKRPALSLLSTDKIRNEFGVDLPDWRIHAKKFISSYIASEKHAA